VTFPRQSGQLPVYYNRRPTSFRSHLDLTREPLWAFGFGLSYTTFRLDELKVASSTISPDGRTDVSVRVTNTGSRVGDEVVQLYIRDQVSSVTRPIKELRGFARVTLKPGESKTVSFALGPEELSMIDRRMQRVVEPGRFDLMVGTSATPALMETLDVAAR
jgi:Fibronectin type III-like domain